MQITAVPAAPDRLGVALKDRTRRDVRRKSAVTFAMILFCISDAGHGASDLTKSLSLGGCCKGWIHRLPLILLALGCVLQVFKRGRDNTCREGHGDFDLSALEKLKETLRVFLLLVCGLLEDRGDLFKAFLLRLSGPVGIFVASCGLSDESLQQILFCLCSLE